MQRSLGHLLLIGSWQVHYVTCFLALLKVLWVLRILMYIALTYHIRHMLAVWLVGKVSGVDVGNFTVLPF